MSELEMELARRLDRLKTAGEISNCAVESLSGIGEGVASIARCLAQANSAACDYRTERNNARALLRELAAAVRELHAAIAAERDGDHEHERIEYLLRRAEAEAGEAR